MVGTQTIKVTLNRDSLHTPWGFRLQGGADFGTPFIVNKIAAGSPADGTLHRGDLILEIDQKPVGAMHHATALDLVHRAGGQVTFLVQRGLGPLASIMHEQRPLSAMPWSLANATSYLEKNLHNYWAPRSPLVAPTGTFRNRPLERIPDPKPVLSQTGSPLMPGPLPSVSTKTRGFVPPPAFHTPRNNFPNGATADASYSPTRYNHPHSPLNQSSWKDSSNFEYSTYVPSYQKKVLSNPTVQRRNINDFQHQQHYTTIMRQEPQTQPYRPSSVQPTNLVNRQYNSPMSLYSNENIQDVMRSHANHVTRINIIPSTPNPPRVNYAVAVTPSNAYPTVNTNVSYVQSKPNVFASDF